jgi:hypothetical protein
VDASSTEQGHVAALAQVLRGMDAALRNAQQAENEANAPRPDCLCPSIRLLKRGWKVLP